MGVSRWQWLIACALSVASCRLNLPVPEAGALTCRRDSDCPSRQRCAPLVSLCFASLEATPPSVINLAATDATTVVLTLTEPVAPIAADQVSITGNGVALAVTQAALDDTRATLVIRTAAQLPSALYMLSIAVVADQQGNSTPLINLMFTGFGTADSNPPALLGPAPTDIARDLTTTLRWGRITGAQTYQVHVASDANFTKPVPGSPFVTSESSLNITFADPITYYWHVRADVTQSGTTVGSTVEALWRAIYVYCAENTDCSAEAGLEIGNKTKPYRSINRGLAAARALGIGKVVVAGRGGTAAYEESLFYTAGGVNIFGGYDPTFTVNDLEAYPTRLAPQSTAHRIAAVTVPTLVDGIEFHRTAGAADATLNLTGNTDALTLSRIVVGAGSTGMAKAMSVSGEAATGPLLDDLTIVADQPLAGAFLVTVTGPAKWRHLHINLTATGLLFGLLGAGFATLDIADSDIVLSSATVVKAISVGKAALQLARTTIEVSSTNSGGNATAVAVSDSLVDIQQSTLRADGGDAAPLQIGLSELMLVTNSVLSVGDAPASSRVGARLTSVVEGYFFNNTIVVANGTPAASAVAVTGGAVQLVNNVFACDGQLGLSLDAPSVATRVDNNAFVECAPLQRDVSDTTDISLLNGLANHQDNVDAALTVAGALTASGAPTVTGGAAFAALGATLSSCSGNQPCVSMDLQGQPRTAPYCVGAFEVEP